MVPPVANIGSEIKTLSSFEKPPFGNLSKYLVASSVVSSRAYPRWYVFVVGKTSCAFSTKVNPALNIGTIDIGFVGSTTSTFAIASGPCTCASYVSNQSRLSSYVKIFPISAMADRNNAGGDAAFRATASQCFNSGCGGT